VLYETVHVAELGDKSGRRMREMETVNERPQNKLPCFKAIIIQHFGDKQSRMHNPIFLSEITLPINSKIGSKACTTPR